MRAYLLTGYGDIADKVKLSEWPDPRPGATDVVIAIHAAGLNPVDFKIAHGALKPVLKLELPRPFGFDASGVVTAIGSGVTAFRPGDEVFVRASRHTIGSFAEQIVVPADLVALKPKNASHAEAASLPLVGLTTVQGFVDRAHAKSGQSILIHAGSGGVGTFAVQYAKYLGLHVTATTSSRNADFVKSLGADRVIAYDKQNYLTESGGYDIVYDTLGGAFTLDAFKVVKRSGAVITLSGPASQDMARQVHANALISLVMRFLARKVMAASRATGAAYYSYLTESDGRQLADIGKLVEAGVIKPVVDREFAFEKLHDAMAYLEAGRARGKVILTVR